MFAQVWSGALHGVNALLVSVEAHLARGLWRFYVVGLPDSAVRESSYRVRAALKTSGFRFPGGTVTVNLAPADLPKEGSAFDLPIALGILAAHEREITNETLSEYLIVGEVSLDGTLRPTRGVLSLSVCARRAGKRGILVPARNAREASVVEGIDVYPIHNVEEAYELLTGTRSLKVGSVPRDALFRQQPTYSADFAEVRGQQSVKRALEVAAAGGHNLMMVGPPGSGKTMLARRVPSILPAVTLEEAIETTKIHSVGGMLAEDEGVVATRPFRAPHHTISDVGLCGGGSNPSPGEISLAHNGVLFLDELPEFKRSVLEVLRQPLEERTITISRARTTVTYPASFMLIASMNPCRCVDLLPVL
jgi:magnesium chelatase family protein